MSAFFTAAWLADDPAAVELLPKAVDADARRRAVEAAAERQIDPAVLAALRARYPDDACRARHLDALEAGGAACVVTGQQAGLFGGPLYTLHKAAAAVVDARALTAETGIECVPVFWLQSEDHDFEEIATARVLDARGAVRPITLPAPGGADACSVSALEMGEAVEGPRTALAEALAGLEHADAVEALITDCYRPDRSPTAAFGALIDALFASHGLLVVDPCTPGLATAAAPVHRRAVEDAEGAAAALIERVDALEGGGFAVQVHVRAGAPLSFWHPDGRAGPRVRIEPTDGGWQICGADAGPSAAEVERALTAAPDRWSTSALLRPILQDTWLPTAAYIGGPGEIAYFAQLPPLYARWGVPFPLVLHRARLRLIDSTAARLLDQLGLTPADLVASRPALLTRIGGGDPSDGGGADALDEALRGPLTAALDAFRPEAEALDRGLAKLVDRTAGSIGDQIGRLVDRYRRTLARRDEVTVDRLDRLLARLAPDGAPQERVLNWAWFGARYGIDGIVDAILGAIEPFDGTLRDVRL